MAGAGSRRTDRNGADVLRVLPSAPIKKGAFLPPPTHENSVLSRRAGVPRV